MIYHHPLIYLFGKRLKSLSSGQTLHHPPQLMKVFLGTVFVVLSVSAEYGVGPGAGGLKVEEHVRVCVFGFKLMQKVNKC